MLLAKTWPVVDKTLTLIARPYNAVTVSTLAHITSLAQNMSTLTTGTGKFKLTYKMKPCTPASKIIMILL